MAWEFFPVLEDKVIHKYVKDPYNIDKYKAIAKILMVKSTHDNNISIRPQNFLSYKRLAWKAGNLKESYNLTGEIKTSILACA